MRHYKLHLSGYLSSSAIMKHEVPPEKFLRYYILYIFFHMQNNAVIVANEMYMNRMNVKKSQS